MYTESSKMDSEKVELGLSGKGQRQGRGQCRHCRLAGEEGKLQGGGGEAAPFAAEGCQLMSRWGASYWTLRPTALLWPQI